MSTRKTQPRNRTLMKNAIDFVAGDLQYYIEKEYDHSHEDCNIHAEDVYDRHRSCHIINFKVVNANIKSIHREICRGVKDRILIYCIDRILRIHNLDQNEFWEHTTRPDYYGDIFDKIILTNKKLTELSNDLQHLFLMKTKFRIEYVLKKEYGYVIPDLAMAKSYKLITCTKKNLIFKNTHYSCKLNSNVVKSYEEHQLPLGIFRKEQNKTYSVIDGYHRTQSFLNSKRLKAEIIVPC